MRILTPLDIHTRNCAEPFSTFEDRSSYQRNVRLPGAEVDAEQ